MSKRSEIYNAVTSSLEGCCDGPRVYIGEDIPVKKFHNACQAYAEWVGIENCIGMTDETIFGNGKKGFMFTYDGFYYYGEPHVLQLYSSGYSFKRLPELYDLRAVNRLLKELKDIVGAMPDTVKLIDLLADCSDRVVRTAAGSWEHMQELMKEDSDWDEDLLDGLRAIGDLFTTVDTSAIGRLEMVEFPDPDSADASQWVTSYFLFFTCLGALMSRDRELYRGLGMDALTPEREQAIFDDMEKAMEITAPFMTWISDDDDTEHVDGDDDMEPMNLEGYIEEFHKEAVRIDGLLGHPDQLDLDGLRRLFDESKQALGRLYGGIQAAQDRIVSFIETGT